MTARHVVAAVACALAVVAAPTAAYAAPESEVIEGEHLRIVSTLDHDAAGSLSQGETIGWTLEISADAPSAGWVEIGLEGNGDLPVDVTVSRCDVAWIDGVCEAGEEVLHPAAPAPLDGSQVHLVTADAESRARLHVVVAAPAPMPRDSATDLHIVAEGFGEEIGSGPPVPEPTDPPDDGGGGGDDDDLAVTGADLPWPAALGLAAVLCGMGAALIAHWRQAAGDAR